MSTKGTCRRAWAPDFAAVVVLLAAAVIAGAEDLAIVRDQERVELEAAGGVFAGRDLLIGNRQG